MPSQRPPLKKPKAKFTSTKAFLSVYFLAGGIFLIFAIGIYDQTFMPYYIPCGIIITTGLLLSALSGKTLENYLSSKNLFLLFIYHAISTGSILAYGFLATNFYLTQRAESNYQLEIIDKTTVSHKYSMPKPQATVTLKGIRKNFVFNEKYHLDKFSHVNLIVKRGAFGYDIVVSRKLAF